MKYIKIDKNIFFSLFLTIACVVSLYSLFVLKFLHYYLFVFYCYVFVMAYFFYKNFRIEYSIFNRFLFFILALIFISWGQHVFSFFDHQRIKEGTIFFVIGIVFLVVAYSGNIFFSYFLEEKKVKLSYEITIVLFIFVISFILRFYNLEKFFPGVWYDEAQNGAEALRLMNSNNIEFFITRYTYMPSMFFYVSSVFVKLFGYNIISLRLTSVFLGTLSVIAFYFLLKEIFKDWQIAVLGVFIYSFSRWQLNFSRIAFLGIQTVLLLTVFAYFYIKSLKTNKTIYVIAAGLSLGLSHYTYGVAYFIHFVILFHALYFLFKDFNLFFKEKFFIYLKIYVLVILISLPLINFLLKNPGLFFQRANDISFLSEIKNNNSLKPLIKNITSYLLCFNFEGDYNGRHNLYKKPLFDYLSGIFFVIGIVNSLLVPGFRLFFLWLVIMFIPGIISITIETPQFYRIIGAMPAVFIIMILGIYKLIEMLNIIIRDRKFVFIMYLVTAISISAMNFYQYYFLYPKQEGTYLSFSPEASRIGKFINEHKDYLVIVSQAKNMYGFYQWEQKVICDFLTYNTTEYKYLVDSMIVYNAELSYLKKKGVIVILRPSDVEEIKKIETQYKNRFEKKEVYKNPFNNESIFYCYYIDKNDIIKSKDENLILRQE
jgi:4-amino-4-deoxy-L-arabinose transferase-like glycosyltransferase